MVFMSGPVIRERCYEIDSPFAVVRAPADGPYNLEFMPCRALCPRRITSYNVCYTKLLRVKLRRIDAYNSRRRENAALYNACLSDRVLRPAERQGMTHVYHQYTIRSPKRDQIKNRLHEAGVSSVVYYPVPLHLQEALGFLVITSYSIHYTKLYDIMPLRLPP